MPVAGEQTRSSSASDAEEETTVDLSVTDVYTILSNDRRRWTLHLLLSEGAVDGLRELSRRIAARENGVPPEDVTPTQRRRVHVALHQNHLPKLDEADVVDYSPGQSTIELGRNADDFRAYVDVLEGEPFPWPRVYLGLSALAAVILAGVVGGVPPFTDGPWWGWMGAVVASFVVAAATHAVRTRSNRVARPEDGPATK